MKTLCKSSWVPEKPWINSVRRQRPFWRAFLAPLKYDWFQILAQRHRISSACCVVIVKNCIRDLETKKRFPLLKEWITWASIMRYSEPQNNNMFQSMRASVGVYTHVHISYLYWSHLEDTRWTISVRWTVVTEGNKRFSCLFSVKDSK